MEIVSKVGGPDPATVYTGRLEGGELVEFVESVQPPVPRDEKWVLIVSTLVGCPVNCPMCDAGRFYARPLSAGEILEQVDRLVTRRYPDRKVPVPKFKIQFARMGDPAFNPAVPEVLRRLPSIYDAPGLMPCISTIAPRGSGAFLEELLSIKNEFYSGGNFQMQFSIHSTSSRDRRRLIPCGLLGFDRLAEWGDRFHREGDRKIALNFAPVKGFSIEPKVISRYFSPRHFMVKLTPVNPTFSALENALEGVIDPDRPGSGENLALAFENEGFQVVLSIGDTRENAIGSNCGMYVETRRRAEAGTET